MNPLISRRYFVVGLAALSAIPSIREALATTLSGPAQNGEVSIETFSPAGKSLGVARVAKLVKTDAQWQAQLSPLAYRVARQAGTEVAFTGEYDKNHADGVYHCICCDTALYDSRTKFDSHTGWPSFWQPISSTNIVKSSDTTLRCAPGACIRRWPEAHGVALLHEFGRTAFHRPRLGKNHGYS